MNNEPNFLENVAVADSIFLPRKKLVACLMELGVELEGYIQWDTSWDDTQAAHEISNMLIGLGLPSKMKLLINMNTALSYG